MKSRTTLPRTVGFWGAATLPINGMIGSGIFALPAILVAAVNDFAPIMMLIGLLLILPVVLVLSILASQFDRHGGPMLYATEAFGPFVGFQAGWTRFMSGVVASAANMHVAAAYLAVLFPILKDPLFSGLFVVAGLLFITFVSVLGMKLSVRTLGALTLLKLTPLFVLVIVGLATRDPNIHLALPEFSEVESVVLLTFYAYMAFENGCFPAGEVKKPKVTLPLAVMSSVCMVAFFYMLIIWAYIAISPDVRDHTSALAAAADDLTGQSGAIILAVAAAISITANILSASIVIPRMVYGMADLQMLPKIFGYVSERYKTPSFAIMLYGGMAILFSLWAGFTVLAVASTLSRLVMYVLSALALPLLTKDSASGQYNRWHVLLMALGVVTSMWVASHATGQAYLMLGLILVAGTALYLLAKRGRKANS